MIKFHSGSRRRGGESTFLLFLIVIVHVLVADLRTVQCFILPVPSATTSTISRATREEIVHGESTTTMNSNSKSKSSNRNNGDMNHSERKYWEISATFARPKPLPLTPELQHALETNTHPNERQEDMGMGTFITDDWRRAWHTYESPSDNPHLIDPMTGGAEYYIDEGDIDGIVPDDLVGVLYRNGPGKFGVDGERVQHVLDADGLILKITFPPPQSEGAKRKFHFRSRFVQTKAMMEEEEAGSFLYRGTFGTGPWGIDKPPKNGLNKDPGQQSLPCKIVGNALNTNIKNTANTQVVSFGGKLLALYEAGLPHEMNPVTLETIGECDLDGVLQIGKLPVKLGYDTIPEELLPSFIGGAAHTAHPKVCSRSGNLVGWHWSQLMNDRSLEVTFTEWDNDFGTIASSTFKIKDCELAPHDMAMTESCIMLKVNSLKMNQFNFLSGVKGPAAALEMDGRANVFVHVFPRPTAKEQFEPFVVEAPACFSIHFSHAYEDPETGNIISFFSGWPPSDATDFLGAWGGFAPNYEVISPTYFWRMEIDPRKKVCTSLEIAPGSKNACVEHPQVHPNFTTRKAKYVYAIISNLVGDATAPGGYARLEVEDGDTPSLNLGEKNDDIDAYFFGTRIFTGEPLIVPKKGSDPKNEKAAYLLGLIYDAVKDKSAVTVFDLESDLNDGPVATIWLASSVPHGLHGCFAPDDSGSSSIFC